MKIESLLCAVSLVLLSACGPQLVFDAEGIKARVLESQKRYEEVRFDSTSSDPYQLVRAEIVDKKLSITASYVGGCGEADFYLFLGDANQTTSDSVGTRPSVLLLEDKDGCEMVSQKKITISLDEIPAGPYALFIYNPATPGEVVRVVVP